MSNLHFSGARWVWMSALGALVFIGTYLGLVRTYLGQYIENAALIGAQQATSEEVDNALGNLHVISVTSLAVAMLLFTIVGFIRRSWQIALAGTVTLGSATLAAEALKRFLLERPNLADIYQDNWHNSFPSGHTTIAMAILISVLLVSSYRWRGLFMLFSFTWAVSVGSATITSRWHRLSDTIGADMLALVVAALVALWLLKQNSIETNEAKTYPLRVIFVVFIALTAAIGLVSGAIVVVATVHNYELLPQLSQAAAAGVPPNLTAHLDPNFNDNMFIAAQALAYAFSALSALWFWGTFHRIGTVSVKAVQGRPSTLT